MNAIRRALSESRPALGTWAVVPSPIGVELMTRAGFEWVVVDLQHGATGWDAVGTMIQAVELGGGTAVVRVGWNDPAPIMRALDLGARAVIVPMVSTPDEARTVACAMRYPPHGARSWGMTRNTFPTPEAANEDVVCMVMIETAEGLANLDEIAAVPGVDCLFLGPADLGLSLGHGLDRTMRLPAVVEATDALVAAASRHGKFAGTVATDADHAAELIARGVDLVTIGSDKAYILQGAAHDVERIRAMSQRAGDESQRR